MKSLFKIITKRGGTLAGSLDWRDWLLGVFLARVYEWPLRTRVYVGPFRLMVWGYRYEKVNIS